MTNSIRQQRLDILEYARENLLPEQFAQVNQTAFVKAPLPLMLDTSIPDPLKTLYYVIASYSDCWQTCFTSTDTLSEKLGVTSRDIRRKCQALEKIGMLQRLQIPGSTNMYVPADLMAFYQLPDEARNPTYFLTGHFSRHLKMLIETDAHPCVDRDGNLRDVIVEEIKIDREMMEAIQGGGHPMSGGGGHPTSGGGGHPTSAYIKNSTTESNNKRIEINCAALKGSTEKSVDEVSLKAEESDSTLLEGESIMEDKTTQTKSTSKNPKSPSLSQQHLDRMKKLNKAGVEATTQVIEEAKQKTAEAHAHVEARKKAKQKMGALMGKTKKKGPGTVQNGPDDGIQRNAHGLYYLWQKKMKEVLNEDRDYRKATVGDYSQFKRMIEAYSFDKYRELVEFTFETWHDLSQKFQFSNYVTPSISLLTTKAKVDLLFDFMSQTKKHNSQMQKGEEEKGRPKTTKTIDELIAEHDAKNNRRK